jgi:hypothetical protein
VTDQFVQISMNSYVHENASVFEFSLCWSLACLGKTIVLTIKWRKKTRFLT